MENTLKNKQECNWRTISLRALFLAIIISGHLYLPRTFHFNDDITFWITIFFFLIWGIITGLSHTNHNNRQESFLNKVLFKNSLTTVGMVIIFLNIFFSIWNYFVDPIENIGFINNMLRSMIYFFPIITLGIIITFMIGFIPAIAIRIFRKNKLFGNNISA